MNPDAHTDGYKCWQLAIAEIRKQCIRPDGSFDYVKAEWLVNRHKSDTVRKG